MSAAGGRRLIDRPPVVYVGPGALPLLGRREVLLVGRKGAEWVDVTGVLCPRGDTFEALLAERLEETPERGTELVGVAVGARRLRRHRRQLVEELVPGDVILACSAGAALRAYVHDGRGLTEAPVRASRHARLVTTSARRGRRP